VDLDQTTTLVAAREAAAFRQSLQSGAASRLLSQLGQRGDVVHHISAFMLCVRLCWRRREAIVFPLLSGEIDP